MWKEKFNILEYTLTFFQELDEMIDTTVNYYYYYYYFTDRQIFIAFVHSPAAYFPQSFC